MAPEAEAYPINAVKDRTGGILLVVALRGASKSVWPEEQQFCSAWHVMAMSRNLLLLVPTLQLNRWHAAGLLPLGLMLCTLVGGRPYRRFAFG